MEDVVFVFSTAAAVGLAQPALVEEEGGRDNGDELALFPPPESRLQLAVELARRLIAQLGRNTRISLVTAGEEVATRLITNTFDKMLNSISDIRQPRGLVNMEALEKHLHTICLKPSLKGKRTDQAHPSTTPFEALYLFIDQESFVQSPASPPWLHTFASRTRIVVLQDHEREAVIAPSRWVAQHVKMARSTAEQAGVSEADFDIILSSQHRSIASLMKRLMPPQKPELRFGKMNCHIELHPPPEDFHFVSITVIGFLPAGSVNSNLAEISFNLDRQFVISPDSKSKRVKAAAEHALALDALDKCLSGEVEENPPSNELIPTLLSSMAKSSVAALCTLNGFKEDGYHEKAIHALLFATDSERCIVDAGCDGSGAFLLLALLPQNKCERPAWPALAEWTAENEEVSDESEKKRNVRDKWAVGEIPKRSESRFTSSTSVTRNVCNVMQGLMAQKDEVGIIKEIVSITREAIVLAMDVEWIKDLIQELADTVADGSEMSRFLLSIDFASIYDEARRQLFCD